MPRIGYELVRFTRCSAFCAGSEVYRIKMLEIPYLPVERSGVSIPGWVTKPDGKEVYVVFLDEGVESAPEQE